MVRIFITGSSDGLGQLAANLLVSQGHEVFLHARNEERAKVALRSVKGAKDVLIADLSDIEETKRLADEVNSLGRFDAIIHNAGVYSQSHEEIFMVNTLAPYILTSLIEKPRRIIYMSSGLHMHGRPDLDNLSSGSSYSDSKLYLLMLSKAFARKWPDVLSNAVNPGWVPTKMGGSGATDDLEKGFQTQAWLATSDDVEAKVSGRYFFHKKSVDYLPDADDIDMQEKLLEVCMQLSGVPFPEGG